MRWLPRFLQTPLRQLTHHNPLPKNSSIAPSCSGWILSLDVSTPSKKGFSSGFTVKIWQPISPALSKPRSGSESSRNSVKRSLSCDTPSWEEALSTKCIAITNPERKRPGASESRYSRISEQATLDVRVALKEYDKALKGMRKAIENRRHDIRTALVACLLVFCFESLQGNPNAAVSNTQSGLTLLMEYMAAKSPHCTSSYRTEVCAGIERDILTAFLGSTSRFCSFWIREPKTCTGRPLRGWKGRLQICRRCLRIWRRR